MGDVPFKETFLFLWCRLSCSDRHTILELCAFLDIFFFFFPLGSTDDAKQFRLYRFEKHVQRAGEQERCRGRIDEETLKARKERVLGKREFYEEVGIL